MKRCWIHNHSVKSANKMSQATSNAVVRLSPSIRRACCQSQHNPHVQLVQLFRAPSSQRQRELDSHPQVRDVRGLVMAESVAPRSAHGS